MVEFYLSSQDRFTQDTQPHYVNSPREMTRWVRGISEAIRPPDNLAVEGLVRLWAHEALRLFQDRLVEESEHRWTNENMDLVAMKHFPRLDREKAPGQPGRAARLRQGAVESVLRGRAGRAAGAF
uniref:Dynein heavy chain, cytoplasmic n=1 Tax=Culex pipiens TaxID=7175 RepID=A0A8D8DAK5_CULPI